VKLVRQGRIRLAPVERDYFPFSLKTKNDPRSLLGWPVLHKSTWRLEGRARRGDRLTLAGTIQFAHLLRPFAPAASFAGSPRGTARGEKASPSGAKSHTDAAPASGFFSGRCECVFCLFFLRFLPARDARSAFPSRRGHKSYGKEAREFSSGRWRAPRANPPAPLMRSCAARRAAIERSDKKGSGSRRRRHRRQE